MKDSKREMSTRVCTVSRKTVSFRVGRRLFYVTVLVTGEDEGYGVVGGMGPRGSLPTFQPLSSTLPYEGIVSGTGTVKLRYGKDGTSYRTRGGPRCYWVGSGVTVPLSSGPST